MNSSGTDVRPTLHVDVTYKGVSSRFQCNQPLLRIGRRASTQPPPEIAADDPTMSRHHAEIQWQGTNYWITDTGSLTGTYVNGERLLKGDRRPLTTDMQLEFGETRASIRIERQGEGCLFDVFLCHSGADNQQVRFIASELRKAGLNPFLDEEGQAVSTTWIAELSSVLRTMSGAD